MQRSLELRKFCRVLAYLYSFPKAQYIALCLDGDSFTSKKPRDTQFQQVPKLPQLKSFCHGIHISEWPSLKNLEVKRCQNVEIIFAVDLSKSWEEERHGKGHVDDGTPTKKPLFLVDKVAFPNLE